MYKVLDVASIYVFFMKMDKYINSIEVLYNNYIKAKYFKICWNYYGFILNPQFHCALLKQRSEKLIYLPVQAYFFIQRDSKLWTQFRTSLFPELYMLCERST